MSSNIKLCIYTLYSWSNLNYYELKISRIIKPKSQKKKIYPGVLRGWNSMFYFLFAISSLLSLGNPHMFLRSVKIQISLGILLASMAIPLRAMFLMPLMWFLLQPMALQRQCFYGLHEQDQPESTAGHGKSVDVDVYKSIGPGYSTSETKTESRIRTLSGTFCHRFHFALLFSLVNWNIM